LLDGAVVEAVESDPLGLAAPILRTGERRKFRLDAWGFSDEDTGIPTITIDLVG
jgi:hypothetical protein